jgi:large subunit ribosomal protein L6
MSRIGKMPVPLPKGVDVKIDGNLLTVKGPKGQLEKRLPEAMIIKQEDGQLVVERSSDTKEDRSLHGLTRSLVSNMVVGVSEGFSKTLEIVGVGYRASKSGSKLVVGVGYSHPVEIEPPAGIEVEVPAPTKIVIRGADRQAVGQLAAKLRDLRLPEPYKGKGIRYEGEYVRRKAGKAGKVGS